MKRVVAVFLPAAMLLFGMVQPSLGRDRPHGAALDYLQRKLMSCNDPNPDFGQDWAPDNEIAIAVDPNDLTHPLAGSNDYYYSFNNSTGARHAIVPTGFFTSFDGGATWVDGQIPLPSGNGAGDPAPAFQGRDGVALMAQLENVGGQGGCCVTQGNVTVSRSTDGGLTWSRPTRVFKGKARASDARTRRCSGTRNS